MTYKDKLEAVFALVEGEMEDIKKALAGDGEYNSMDGNGCNSHEANAVLSPIAKAIKKIVTK